MLGRILVGYNLTKVIVITTILVIALGGTIRIYDAGESCPDWPQCFGTWGFMVDEAEQAAYWEVNPDQIDSRGAEHRYTTFEIFVEILRVAQIKDFASFFYFVLPKLYEGIKDDLNNDSLLLWRVVLLYRALLDSKASNIHSFSHFFDSEIDKMNIKPTTSIIGAMTTVTFAKTNVSGKDIIAQAQSGTGKTGAFLIGALQKLEIEKKETQIFLGWLPYQA